MNQRTVKVCPIHGLRMKIIYTTDYKRKQAIKEKVFEDARCIECLRDHDVMCEKLEKAKVVIING